MELFSYRAGSAPLLVSMPHTGTFIPEWLAPRLSPAARALPDTDWHLERLYSFLDELGASVLVATHYMDYLWRWALVRAAYRAVVERPRLLGGLVLWLGFAWSRLTRRPGDARGVCRAASSPAAGGA